MESLICRASCILLTLCFVAVPYRASALEDPPVAVTHTLTMESLARALADKKESVSVSIGDKKYDGEVLGFSKEFLVMRHHQSRQIKKIVYLPLNKIEAIIWPAESLY